LDTPCSTRECGSPGDGRDRAWRRVTCRAARRARPAAPLLTSADPDAQDLTGGVLASPGAPGHLLGTDQLGRDILARLPDIVQDILAIVTLSYLGLGIQPPTPDWGSMISAGQTFLTSHWQLTTIPGLAVVVTGLALSLLGDGLADLLRPGGRA
jgi:ABC-type dipeptide/oligopeptide/nickel transport system permease subunit